MNENLLTKEELSVRINISSGMIDKLRKQKKIRAVKVGRTYRYNLERVQEDLKNLGEK